MFGRRLRAIAAGLLLAGTLAMPETLAARFDGQEASETSACVPPVATERPPSPPVEPNPNDPDPDLIRLALRLSVRTTVHADLVQAILDQAARIWTPQGVALSRQASDVPGRQAPPATDEVHVILDEAGPRGEGSTGPQRTLAWVEFLGPGRPRNVIHLSIAGARWMRASVRLGGRPLERWPSDLSRRFLVHALGRSLAHEIGHYLLGSSRHTADGLMRATFSPEELIDARLGRYRLATAQRSALLARAPACSNPALEP